MKRDVFLCLEPKGTILEVIRAAKLRGMYVVAVISDPSLLEAAHQPYASAISCIDEKISISSWSDPDIAEKIIATISTIGEVRGVFAGLDPCGLALAQLRERYQLPTPKPSTLATILNKHSLRKTLQQLKLSKLRTWHSKEVDGWKTWVPQGPAYFKPIHGAFSAYVERCQSLEELKKAKATWQNRKGKDSQIISDYLGQGDEFHVEEAIDGELLSVEAISTNGDFKCLGILSRILYSKNSVVEMGSCFPYPHPRADEIIDKVKRSHMALGFTDGPTHTEVIVGSNGTIEIIDLNPRFVGADVLHSINHAYGIKIEELLLDWACGKPVKFEPRTSLFACLQYILPPSSLEFQSITLPDLAEVKFSTRFAKVGAQITSSDRQLDYLGCYLTVMNGFTQALNRSHELRSSVRINNIMEGAY